MFSKFSEDAQKALLIAKKEMASLNHPYVGSEHLLLAILSFSDSDLTQKLSEYNIDYKGFKEELIKVVGKGSISNSWFLYTPLLKRIIENATIDCRENKDKEVTLLHLFLALLEEGDGVAIRILMGMNVDIDLLYDEFSTDFVPKKSKSKHKLLIEDFAIDLNQKCLNSEVDPVIGREDEINQVIEILSRRCKNNPLLIGEAGVGKTAIVEALANRIVLGLVPESLKNKRILSVSMASLIAGTKYRGEFEERINKIIKEVEATPDIILFIDEVHTLIGAGGAEGAIDASNILKPALARGKIKLIGATTTDEYLQFLEKDKALDRRFQRIKVVEPSKEKTIDILTKMKSIYESFHHTSISDEIILEIVSLCDEFIHNRRFPDKAIDILDEVCVKTALTKNKDEEKLEKLQQKLNMIKKLKKDEIVKEDFFKATELKNEQSKLESKINKLQLKNQKNMAYKVITKDIVMEVISHRRNVPLCEFSSSNKQVLGLENKLRSKIMGQDEAIKVICDYTKRKQLNIFPSKVHSFLLVGKTGVGKTMLVKEYAKELYHHDSFIRLDMSEYKEAHSISKIIGSPPGYIGYDEHNYLLEKIRNNPHSVLLLDEIEKASTDVVKLFLQALDEGKMKDSRGNEVYFNHVVIFMTSNLGMGHDTVGFSSSSKNNIPELTDFFGVEFMNRIDDVLVFNSLDDDVITGIIKNKLKKLRDYYKKNSIILSFSKKLISEIKEDSSYEKYGARRIDKTIDRKINNYIINQILSGSKDITVPSTL